MIGWLRGVLRRQAVDHVLLDAGGVGYRVHVPTGTHGQTAVGADVELEIYTHVREDGITLFGFETLDDLAVFEVLITVKGVGPRMAMGVLGALGAQQLALAVESGDIARLKSAKGVGKRLAERLALELKGKLPTAGGSGAMALGGGGLPQGDMWRDLASALSNLQYRRKEIDAALSQLALEHEAESDFDVVLRAALSVLRR